MIKFFIDIFIFCKFKSKESEYKVGFFCEEEEAQLEDDIIAYIKALRKKLMKNQKILEKKAKRWKATFGSAVHRRKVLKETKLTKELYEYIIQRMRNEYKDKNKNFKFIEKIIKMDQDRRFEFSDIIYEWLTPKKHKEYSDSKLPIIAAEASQLGIKVGISPEFLPKETSKLLDSIEKFVKAVQKRGI